MTDLFADAVGTVSITNGVLRVELVQLRPNSAGDKLTPYSVGVLHMPAGSLKNVTMRLAGLLEKSEERRKGGKAAAEIVTDEPSVPPGGIEEALTKL
jgi:hypothetical protein